jgi:hypothetical protein
LRGACVCEGGAHSPRWPQAAAQLLPLFARCCDLISNSAMPAPWLSPKSQPRPCLPVCPHLRYQSDRYDMSPPTAHATVMCTTASDGRMLGPAAAAVATAPAPRVPAAAAQVPRRCPMTERAAVRSAAPAAGLPCQACAAIVGAASRPVPTHLQAQRGTELGARVSYGWVIFLCYQQRPLCRAQALLLWGLHGQWARAPAGREGPSGRRVTVG